MSSIFANQNIEPADTDLIVRQNMYMYWKQKSDDYFTIGAKIPTIIDPFNLKLVWNLVPPVEFWTVLKFTLVTPVGFFSLINSEFPLSCNIILKHHYTYTSLPKSFRK